MLPLFVGFFSLSLPAGMGLYWLSNNVFTTSITYYLKYLGGAKARWVLEHALTAGRPR